MQPFQVIDRYLPAADGLRLHVRCYEPAQPASGAHPAICLPGLARTTEDFDTLARALASDDDAAAAEIGALAENLGFSPIKLGGLLEGGLLVQARGNSWGQLIFKDLVKFN